MKIGLVGLGRMGARMGARWMSAGHEIIGFDQIPDSVRAAKSSGITGAQTLKELVDDLPVPRIVWVMVPAGDPTSSTINELALLLSKGDVVIDGGNSYFKDDFRHADILSRKGIEFLDVGTSGGIWGESRGYCLMIGGSKEAFHLCKPLFEALAPGTGNIERTRGRSDPQETSERGYLHCGPVGSGHFVKMVHNGIEYGMMEAFAEGFALIQRANETSYLGQKWDFKTEEIAEVWRRGSVVSSWLLDLIAIALKEDPGLSHLKGKVPDSGEGRWTVETAIEQGIQLPVITSALFARFQSRDESSYGNRLLSAMREQFGGHREGK